MPETTQTPTDILALVRNGTGDWTLDPASSSVEFHVKHFWGVITVHGRFDKLTGEGCVAAHGSVSGQLQFAAGSVNTNNRKRDEHLRSSDFFDAEHHPTIVVSASGLVPAGTQVLRGKITLDAAGHQETLDPTIQVIDITADAVTLRAETNVDRTTFEMTWRPLGMASPQARAVVTTRFVRK